MVSEGDGPAPSNTAIATNDQITATHALESSKIASPIQATPEILDEVYSYLECLADFPIGIEDDEFQRVDRYENELSRRQNSLAIMWPIKSSHFFECQLRRCVGRKVELLKDHSQDCKSVSLLVTNVLQAALDDEMLNGQESIRRKFNVLRRKTENRANFSL